MVEQRTIASEAQQKGAEQASSRAITALILGIVGLFFLLAGPFAWIYGHRERKAIKAGESAQAGMTLATIGWILGIIETAIIVLLPILMAIIIPIILGSRMQ